MVGLANISGCRSSRSAVASLEMVGVQNEGSGEVRKVSGRIREDRVETGSKWEGHDGRWVRLVNEWRIRYVV